MGDSLFTTTGAGMSVCTGTAKTSTGAIIVLEKYQRTEFPALTVTSVGVKLIVRKLGAL